MVHRSVKSGLFSVFKPGEVLTVKSFKDNAGRTWVLSVNVDTIKRVRALCDVDLLKAVEGKLIEELATDVIKLVDVVYAVVKPDADKLGITDVDFGSQMGGEALDGATSALFEDLVDFFPKGRRQVMAKALSKITEIQAKGFGLMSTRLDKVDIDSLLKTASDSFTKSQGRSE